MQNLIDGTSTSCGCYRQERLQEGWKKWRDSFSSAEEYRQYISLKIKKGLDVANSTVVK